MLRAFTVKTPNIWLKSASSLGVTIILMSSLAIVPTAAAAVPTTVSPGSNDQLFSDSSQEFGVPKQLLLAISYNETRWQSRAATPSVDDGYGPMDLRQPDRSSEDGRGDNRHDSRRSVKKADSGSLDQAATLLQVDPSTLKKDDRQNIRGAAAVLAMYAKQLNGDKLPADIAGWYNATAKYSGSDDEDAARAYADSIYATIQQGAAAAPDATVQKLAPTPDSAPKDSSLRSLGLPKKNKPATNASGAQCPKSLVCRFVPAGYAQNSSDPADYGNYDHANRPKDMSIKYIVIHDTEGSYQSAINHFQDTSSYVSCNYVIRSADGEVTQMVRNEDVGWCAGDWYVNMHSINIEHEGFAAQGDAWYTEAMYQSSAKLVRYLAAKYNVPLDREHIIGHDDVPTISPASMPNQHWDPGPYWDWNHYMALLHGVSDQAERSAAGGGHGSQKVVSISPDFATNQPVVTDCSSGTCAALPAQGTNLVYLRTAPSATAPLVSDKYVHADGAAGTTGIDDWGSKAATGQRYAVAAKQGDWTAIWYGGSKAWFYNPANKPTAVSVKSATVTPRNGKVSIPVYGAAYPESSVYPSGVPVQTLSALYTLPAGQSYATTGENLPTDYFYDATINYSLPHDHEVIRGNEKYYQITYNKRIAYVKASDVTLRD